MERERNDQVFLFVIKEFFVTKKKISEGGETKVAGRLDWVFKKKLLLRK